MPKNIIKKDKNLPQLTQNTTPWFGMPFTTSSQWMGLILTTLEATQGAFHTKPSATHSLGQVLHAITAVLVDESRYCNQSESGFKTT